MAARPYGWLGAAFGLRLLLATVLETVSGGHLCCSPRASDRDCAKENGIFGPFWETQLKRVGSPSGCCSRRATWLYSAFDDYLSPPWVPSDSFSWPESILSTVSKTRRKSGAGKTLSFAKEWRLFLNWQKCKELSLWQSFLSSLRGKPSSLWSRVHFLFTSVICGLCHSYFFTSVLWHSQAAGYTSVSFVVFKQHCCNKRNYSILKHNLFLKLVF